MTLQYIAKMRTPGCEKNLRCRTTTTDVHTQEPVMPLRLLTRPSQSCSAGYNPAPTVDSGLRSLPDARV